MDDSKETIKKKLEEAKKEFDEFGGWASFKSGEWLWHLIQKSFSSYWENANAEYFEEKYETKDTEFIAKKLIDVAAKNAGILGGITGLIISADEVTAIYTAGELVVGIPANIAIAVAAIGSEAILLMRMQLQLVANLGKIYKVPLDPEDPEDVLTILAFALGGSAADAASKLGVKVGKKVAEKTVKKVFKKETLAALQKIAAKIGLKILQRSIVKYTVPLVSIVIGSGWNYASTKTIGRISKKHFKKRVDELNGSTKNGTL